MTSGVANQARNLPLLATPSLTAGRTYIVTGANTGLGFEAAKHLAALGAAKVILAVRTLASGDLAKQEIDTAAGTAGKPVVEVWPLDLCRYDSVKKFVHRVEAELERVDGVVLNAALAPARREVAEGHSMAVTVNVLSTMLLAVLLLPVVKGKATRSEGVVVPRIVVVTSRVGFDSREDWEGIKGDFVQGMDGEGVSVMKTWVLSFLSPCCPSQADVLTPEQIPPHQAGRDARCPPPRPRAGACRQDGCHHQPCLPGVVRHQARQERAPGLHGEAARDARPLWTHGRGRQPHAAARCCGGLGEPRKAASFLPGWRVSWPLEIEEA